MKPVQEWKKGLTVNVYGRGKTGKTRFASTFPKPLLLIGTEDGTKSVKGIDGIDFVRIRSADDFDQLLEGIPSKGYQTVVSDTAGGAQDIFLKDILGLDELPMQRSWGMAKQQDWQICGAQFKERFGKLLSFAESDGTNIVVIAHERSFNDEAVSDIMFPTIGSALTPSVSGWLNGACDYICQTFIREKTVQKEAKIGAKKKVAVTRKTGEKEYCLRIGPHEIFMTGFRISPEREKQLPNGILPEAIVNPSYNKIIELLG